MPTIHVEDFWNLPVNPVWRVPGFMKEGKADNELSNPVLLPICISHLQLLHFQKIFVRSRRDWEKKCRMGIRQYLTVFQHLEPPYFSLPTTFNFVFFSSEWR